jgi:hypothetical protein
LISIYQDSLKILEIVNLKIIIIIIFKNTKK